MYLLKTELDTFIGSFSKTGFTLGFAVTLMASASLGLGHRHRLGNFQY